MFVQYVGRRLALIPITLLGVSAIVFVLARIVPGRSGPARRRRPGDAGDGRGVPPGVPPATVRSGSSTSRTWAACCRAISARSMFTGRPVLDDLRAFLPATLELTAVGITLALAGRGARPASSPRSIAIAGPTSSRAALALTGVSFPVFWLAHDAPAAARRLAGPAADRRPLPGRATRGRDDHGPLHASTSSSCATPKACGSRCGICCCPRCVSPSAPWRASRGSRAPPCSTSSAATTSARAAPWGCRSRSSSASTCSRTRSSPRSPCWASRSPTCWRARCSWSPCSTGPASASTPSSRSSSSTSSRSPRSPCSSGVMVALVNLGVDVLYGVFDPRIRR